MKLIATVDELLILCPNLYGLVSLLICGCNESAEGKEALKKWDEFRKLESNDTQKSGTKS
jgi:hypothetical protein